MRRDAGRLRQRHYRPRSLRKFRERNHNNANFDEKQQSIDENLTMTDELTLVTAIIIIINAKSLHAAYLSRWVSVACIAPFSSEILKR